MSKQPLWKTYKAVSAKDGKFKSKRAHEFDYESAVKLRKKVLMIFAGLILLYVFYLLFISEKFTIKNISLEGETSLPAQEIYEIINKALAEKYLWLVPKSNYFILKKTLVISSLRENNILADITLKKGFPDTLKVIIDEQAGRLVWISSEIFYLMKENGVIESQLPARELINSKIPVVHDKSNSRVEIGQGIVDEKLVSLVLETFNNFKTYELPIIEIDYFTVDTPEANFIKIITKQGFEIHLNYLKSLDDQLNKLKKSLQYGKIDLENVNYINLRVEDQVIYK